MTNGLGRLIRTMRAQTLQGSNLYTRKAFPYAMRYLGSPFLAHFYANKIRATIPKDEDVQKSVESAYSFGSLGLPLRIDQIREEISGMMNLVQANPPRRCLEIGTAGGGTLFLIAGSAHPEARIISIDLPGGLYGLGYPIWKIPMFKAFARKNQEIVLLRADSHSPETLEKVRSELAGEKLDFLFIDGDHTYEGVKKDFEMYSSLVREGGIVGFHDIVPHATDRTVDVSRFWNELKRDHSHKEFVHSWDQGWAGIGVVVM